MGTITTSTGLISGLNIEDIVTKLMAIEKRPVDLLNARVAKLSSQQTALLAISAQITAAKLAALPFKSGVTFRPNTAASSDTSILNVTANSDALPGQYSFRVLQTAQAHQVASKGFDDSGRTSVGSGLITIEVGHGRLDRSTELGWLNGQQGVQRGKIRITDRSGASATVDLTGAQTVADVLDRINQASGISVAASVRGDRIVLNDLSGGTTSDLIVAEVSGGQTAADLGLLGRSSSAELVGRDVLGLNDSTVLRLLNDGNGVRTNDIGNDLVITLSDGSSFSAGLRPVLTADTPLSLLNSGRGVRAGSIVITDRAGTTATVDLSTARTVGEVLTAINQASPRVTASIVGAKLLITDSSGGTGSVKIANAEGSQTAGDLGIVGESTKASITGQPVYSIDTVGDVLRAVQYAADSQLGAGKFSIGLADDGDRLVAADLTGGTGEFSIASADGSRAAEDLGLAGSTTGGSIGGRRLLAGLNTVLLRSLNGGRGVAGGRIEIQDRTGASAQIDLSAAETLQDVIEAVNGAGLQVRAGLNGAGTGLVIEDTSGAAAANLRIADVDSTTAADLGIAVDAATNRRDAVNNQLQYVSEATLLADLNGGKGIATGQFIITDSSGTQATVTVSSSLTTVGDLIDAINNLSAVKVRARINDTGDGILLEDQAGGGGLLAVRDKGTGTTAKELRLAGQADHAGAGSIDGSYEYRIELGGSDTLQTLLAKIKALGAPVSGDIINDGSGTNAYRLSLISARSGRAGELVINTGTTELGFYNVVSGQDAVIAIGGSQAANPVVVTSSSNTFTKLVNGLTLTAQRASDTPVTVTVSRDLESVVSKLQTFVDNFNSIIDLIGQATAYNPETQEAGALLGNSTIQQVRERLYQMIRYTTTATGSIRRLSDLGIGVGSGAKLQFDEEKFRAAYAANAADIEKFFSTKDTGFGYTLDNTLDLISRAGDGIITRASVNYDDQKTLLNDRIADLNKRLATKEQRLYSQFYAMETALANLQSMSTALDSISYLTNSSSSSSSKSSSS